MQNQQRTHYKEEKASPLYSEKMLTGQVLSINQETGALMVQSRIGTLKANIAFSCHTQPKEQDQVLLVDTDAGIFITTILSRQKSSTTTLNFPQGVAIISSKNLVLESHEELELKGTSKTSVITANLSIAALKSRIRVLDLVAQVNDFKGRFSKLSWISEWAEQKANVLRQRFVRSDRKVEQQDLQQAGNLIQRVDKTASLRAEHAIIKARKDVQVDGKRIHMG